MAYDVVCIGNAIVDLIAHVPEEFIVENGFARGGMTLVNAVESERRITLCGHLIRKSGGSVANTAACLASLGSKVGFVGKVGDDQFGQFFKNDLSSIGVDFLCEEDHSSVSTANCLAVVTPDGERTMSTYLGACTHLSKQDISESVIRDAKLVLVEGYLLDSPSSRDAVFYALELSVKWGTKLAITLSDARCVERNLEDFNKLSSHSACDVVIANEKEIGALYAVSAVEEAINHATTRPKITVITLGGDGALATKGKVIEKVEALPVTNIVDLVGAGDSFAAGFLHSMINHSSLTMGLELGSKCASVIIQQDGARPQTSLSSLSHLPV